MNTAVETHSFQAEAKQLLSLMIHSVYSNKEIFLRELISNASDALDKLRFEALTDPALLAGQEELGIRIAADAKARTLTISDNGIGMSRAEVVENIGTIARSGTKEMIDKIKQSGQPLELIGQFGIGFYSVFMVADRVELLTRRAGTDEATLWESTGDGEYTIKPAEKAGRGTSITLHLKPSDAEDGLEDVTQREVVADIVKRYSDFVQYPLRFGDEDKPLNSQKPLWARPQAEVKPEEYAEFYRHLSHDWNEPAKVISLKAEGTSEYQALLFVPKKAPFDLFFRDQKRGLQLFVKRVMIMESCEELLPTFLRFVKGVVDSSDLPLNVSREILQHNRQIALMQKRLTKKVLDTLTQLLSEERGLYLQLWKEFGPVIKEGFGEGREHQERLTELLLVASTHSESEPTTLKDYVSRMKPEQDAIYFITGESRAAAERSPHLELFKERGYEVLLFLDTVDELVTSQLQEFEGKKLRNVSKGGVELPAADQKKIEEVREEKQKQLGSLLERLAKLLEEQVSAVRLSDRLTSSPACLVGGENDLSPHLERLLQQTQKGMPKQKRVLELNPNHPLMSVLHRQFIADGGSPLLADFAELLYGQALLAEGSPLPDPVKFAKLVAETMVRAGGV